MSKQNELAQLADAVTVDGGKVGIKTSSPSSYLSGNLVVGDSNSDQYVSLVSGSANAAGLMFQDTTGTSIVGGIRYTHSDNALAAWTNGAEAMHIDASGRVTMPSQPSFKAYRAGGAINTNYTDLVFNDTSSHGGHNVGGHYNTANGRFTCPCDGRYLFTAQLLTNPSSSSNSYMTAFYRINGTFVAFLAHSHLSSWVTEGGAMILSLSASDYVDLYLERGSGHYGIYSYFSGTLLG